MCYITHIHIEASRNVENLDIDLSVPPQKGDAQESREQVGRAFRHLILTGPNGSGKSGLLATIASKIEESILLTNRQLVLFNTGQNELQWSCDARELPAMFERGDLIVPYLDARRAIQPREVRGPRKLKRKKLGELGPSYEERSSLPQLLTNKHTEMTYAIAKGDREKADRIGSWLKQFERHMRTITEDEGLVAEYQLDSFRYEFRRSDGYAFDLNTLADGHAAMLALLAELLIRVDNIRSSRRDYMFEPAGVVIVDEIETHLHPSLQEQILPFLTDVFPRFQFIVATHSPAVIASIPNAVVCDLKHRSQTLSDHFRGVRYGTLMTEHFGISSEIDLDSTEKLLRFRELAGAASRTEAEQRNFEELGEILSARSRSLAVEVWTIREGLGQSSSTSKRPKR
jgi:predicted ATPase